MPPLETHSLPLHLVKLSLSALFSPIREHPCALSKPGVSHPSKNHIPDTANTQLPTERGSPVPPDPSRFGSPKVRASASKSLLCSSQSHRSPGIVEHCSVLREHQPHGRTQGWSPRGRQIQGIPEAWSLIPLVLGNHSSFPSLDIAGGTHSRAATVPPPPVSPGISERAPCPQPWIPEYQLTTKSPPALGTCSE